MVGEIGNVIDSRYREYTYTIRLSLLWNYGTVDQERFEEDNKDMIIEECEKLVTEVVKESKKCALIHDNVKRIDRVGQHRASQIQR